MSDSRYIDFISAYCDRWCERCAFTERCSLFAVQCAMAMCDDEREAMELSVGRAPSEDGEGAFRCMTMALKRAGLSPSDIDYINAHGTSTMADTIELGAVERLVGNAASKISMSSTKSAIGHLLGAAGAVEAIFSTLAIRDNIAPPTLNLDNPDVDTAIDLVPHKARQREINVALSNSFGFGGTNASIVLRRYEV